MLMTSLAETSDKADTLRIEGRFFYPWGRGLVPRHQAGGGVAAPPPLSNLVEFQSWRGVDRFFLQPVARVLIDTQQRGGISMAHDLRHRFHVRAMLKGFRGHGMALYGVMRRVMPAALRAWCHAWPMHRTGRPRQ